MRIIAHVDMDAFFAAIEERDNPQFRGKPIVIGAEPKKGLGRGVVSTANYKARKYGIHSAMPISTAWQLSEDRRIVGGDAVVFLPVEMEKYAKSSDKIMEVVRTLVPTIEQVSVDEAYLDLSFTGSYAKAKLLAEKIKKLIFKTEHLTASVGIGPNKLIAKIASDMEKPNGLTVITEKNAESILEPLAVRTIPGIGPKTEKILNHKKIFLVRDLKQLSEADLYDLFGQWGLELYDKARGRDESELITSWEAKSISEQETFEEDADNFGFISDRVRALCQGVFETFQKSEFKSFKRIVLTMRFQGFKTKTRSKTLQVPAKTLKVLNFEILKMLMPFFDSRENPNRQKYRLVGVRIEELET